jgi:SAM-dependent methyltransferase
MSDESPIPLPETPLDAIRDVVRDKVIVEGRTFLIERPDASDRLLQNAVVKAQFAVDEYLPFWADLWPASRMLAKAILRENWPAPADGQPLLALEVGCGLGLSGVVALARGLRVVFSDYDATALQFAANNARLNHFDNFELLRFDWRWPPTDLSVPVILAADLLYELRNVEPLVKLIKKVLRPDGVCLMTDQDRPPAHHLREMLPNVGLSFTSQRMTAGEPGGRRYKGTLYRIVHAPA